MKTFSFVEKLAARKSRKAIRELEALENRVRQGKDLLRRTETKLSALLCSIRDNQEIRSRTGKQQSS